MSDGRHSQENVVDITDRILEQLRLPPPYEGLDRIGLIVLLSDDMLHLSMLDLASLARWMTERVYTDQADSDT